MKGLWILSLSFSLFVLLTPPPLFYKTLLPFQLVTFLVIVFMMIQIIRASLKNVPHSRICLVGLLIFFFGITWDILLYQGFLPFIELTFYTSITFVFIQSHIIAINFSEAYKMAEELNKKLEDKVQRRTKVI